MRVEENQQKDLIEILHLCSSGLSVLGSKDFKNALNNIIVSHEISNKQHSLFIDYIFDCVIKEWSEYDWKKEDFFKSNQRGEIIVARNVIIVLMKMHIKLTYAEIADYFGLGHKQRINEIIRKHENTEGSRHRLDVKLRERYDRLDMKVLTYIDNLKQHKNG